MPPRTATYVRRPVRGATEAQYLTGPQKTWRIQRDAYAGGAGDRDDEVGVGVQDEAAERHLDRRGAHRVADQAVGQRVRRTVAGAGRGDAERCLADPAAVLDCCQGP